MVDTANEVSKVIESSKEHSISTPVAIHIDRIPSIDTIEEVYALDSGITLVGPERKWVFETWRVEDINNTTLPIVDLSFDLDLSNIDNELIIAPRSENATIGWFMNNIKTLRLLRKNNV